MSIQDFGAIGELLGAVLLLGSLIYVALQIRQNALGQRAIIRQHWTEQALSWNRQILENEELRKLVMKGRAEGFQNLGEDEQVRLWIYYQSACWTFSSFYRHYSDGLFDDRNWYEAEQLIQIGYVASVGFGEYWLSCREEFDDEFRSYMDDQVKRGS